MLTQDENIVEIDIAIQYNIKDTRAFLFNVRDPDLTLQETAESSIREVIGKNDMDFIVTQGRDDVASRTELLLQGILDRYNTGLLLQTVNLQDAQPPEAVQAAFADAIKAREDEQRFINQAEAYSNGIIPNARGDAKQMLEEAKAYRTRVVKSAEGEARRFLDLLKEYQKAPRVTRDRLYLDTVESVLSKSSKVMVDVKGGNNLLYLPLDKLIRTESGSPASTAGASQGMGVSGLDNTAGTDRRSRETR
jgi:membrane protease subunit HflK